MPLPGGPSDKLGNRFELRWTVRRIVDLITGRLQWIRIEPPGQDAIEFRCAMDRREEAHQVKRGVSTGHWTIAALASVLDGFGGLLGAEDDLHCVFVSEHARRSSRSSPNALGNPPISESSWNTSLPERQRPKPGPTSTRVGTQRNLLPGTACDASHSRVSARGSSKRTLMRFSNCCSIRGSNRARRHHRAGAGVHPSGVAT
jgi:hypothetical protein